MNGSFLSYASSGINNLIHREPYSLQRNLKAVQNILYTIYPCEKRLLKLIVNSVNHSQIELSSLLQSDSNNETSKYYEFEGQTSCS